MKIRRHLKNKQRVVKNRKRIYTAWKKKRVPKFECKDIKEAWARGKTLGHNFRDMGLALNPNKAVKSTFESNESDELSSDSVPKLVRIPEKKYVADNLETEAREPRERKIRLPDGEVRFIAQMMTRYGNNYEKMAQDTRNKWQWTAAKFRAKIKRFVSIEEQYNFYLSNRKTGCKWKPEDPNFDIGSTIEFDLF